MAVKDITVSELKEMLTNGSKIKIVDVRRPEEYKIIHVNGSELIPMNDLKERLDDIDWNENIVILCRTGARSAAVADFLSKTRKDVSNLLGGIQACYEDDGMKEHLNISDESLIEGYFP